MAFDVAVKAVSANAIEGGDIIIAVEANGGYQRLDQTEEVASPFSDTALSGAYFNRFDNKGYY